jgi:predicted transcriptional regulator
MNVTERITITIPDDLHKRLQEVKEKLNVSRICSRAITDFPRLTA